MLWLLLGCQRAVLVGSVDATDVDASDGTVDTEGEDQELEGELSVTYTLVRGEATVDCATAGIQAIDLELDASTISVPCDDSVILWRGAPAAITKPLTVSGSGTDGVYQWTDEVHVEPDEQTEVTATLVCEGCG